MRKGKSAKDYREGDFIPVKNDSPLDILTLDILNIFARILSRKKYVEEYEKPDCFGEPTFEDFNNIYYMCLSGKVGFKCLDSLSIVLYGAPQILSLGEVRSRLGEIIKESNRAIELVSG